MSTHHHWDHLGGVRAYVAQEGVTIVLQENNHSYYAEVLRVKPWMLKPDRLALAPPEEVAEGYTFEKVGQKYVLTDGTKVMEIYNVQGLAHAQGMLMAYLPKEKIVVEADLFTPPAQGAPLPTMVAPASADVLQQRAAAEAGRADDRADPRRSHVSVGGFREVRQQRGDELANPKSQIPSPKSQVLTLGISWDLGLGFGIWDLDGIIFCPSP